MIRHLATTAAAALVIATLVPVSAASAADTTLTGVLSGSSGPQAGLVIGWVEAEDFASFETTTTGASGQYSLDIPDDIGDYLLFTNASVTNQGVGRAIDPEYTAEFFGSGGDRDFLRTRVDPFPAPITGPLDITLTASGTISGTAEAYSGRAIFLWTLGHTEAANVDVADDGAYEFDGLYPGKYTISGYQPGLTTYRSPTISVTPGSETELDINPQPTATISGVVKNGSTPLKGITVAAYLPSDPDYAVGSAHTASNGTYSVVGLQPGDYRLTFTSHPTSASKSFLAESVSVPHVQAAENRRVDERLASAGFITGRFTREPRGDYYFVRVYNSSGRYVASTSLDSTVSRFKIGALAAGRYTLHFTESLGKRYDSTSVTVSAHKSRDVGARTLAKKTTFLNGYVTGTTRGYITASLGGSEIARTTIRSTGKYRIRGLVPGTYSISTNVTGFEKRTIMLKMSSARTKTLTTGKSMGLFTGLAVIGGTPAEVYGTYKSRGSTLTYFEGLEQKFRGYGKSGPATLVAFTAAQTPLPERSPYWYAAPAAVRNITLTSGATTNLGTFELELQGIPDDVIP